MTGFLSCEHVSFQTSDATAATGQVALGALTQLNLLRLVQLVLTQSTGTSKLPHYFVPPEFHRITSYQKGKRLPCFLR